MNIVKRFSRLVGTKMNASLCAYRHTNGSSVRHITASNIEATFRLVVAHVYKLNPVKDCVHLHMWSAHSLRVGACVILHGMGFTDSQIRFILRWRSNASSRICVTSPASRTSKTAGSSIYLLCPLLFKARTIPDLHTVYFVLFCLFFFILLHLKRYGALLLVEPHWFFSISIALQALISHTRHGARELSRSSFSS